MSEVKTRSPWWLDREITNNVTPVRSPWLKSALADLDEKTKSMLKIIEEDADSFAQRAEMYYKKRPELVNMVEDFYRSHRFLAERFDQLKADPVFRQITPWSSSPLSLKNQQKQQQVTCSDKSYDSYSETFSSSLLSLKNQQKQQQVTCSDKSYDSYSETFDPMESCESDVDDPEEEEEYQIHRVTIKEEVSKGVVDSDELVKLKGEIERLKQENKIQKEQLEEKDEEKREVIRQLSVAIDTLKDENLKLRKRCIITETPKKGRNSEFRMLKNMFTGKLFKGSSN